MSHSRKALVAGGAVAALATLSVGVALALTGSSAVHPYMRQAGRRLEGAGSRALAFSKIQVVLPAGGGTFSGEWPTESPEHVPPRLTGYVHSTPNEQPNEIYLNSSSEMEGISLQTVSRAKLVLTIPRVSTRSEETPVAAFNFVLGTEGKGQLTQATKDVELAAEIEGRGEGAPCYYVIRKLPLTYPYVVGGERDLEVTIKGTMKRTDELGSHPAACPGSLVLTASASVQNNPGEPLTVVYP